MTFYYASPALKASESDNHGLFPLAPRCCKKETGRSFGVKRLVCMSENRMSTASTKGQCFNMPCPQPICCCCPSNLHASSRLVVLGWDHGSVELGMGIGISRIRWIFSRICRRSFWWNVWCFGEAAWHAAAAARKPFVVIASDLASAVSATLGSCAKELRFCRG